MKRALILILALTLLWGCAPVEAPATDATLPDQEGPLTLLVEDSKVEDPHDWLWFYYNTQNTGLSNNEAYNSIQLTHRYGPDNLNPEWQEFHSTLTWDGEVFTLTEEEGTFTYKYLVYSANGLPEQSNYDFAEYFLLSDDPEMTAETYFSSMLSSTLPDEPIAPTRVVYSDYHAFDRAEEYGEATADVSTYLELSFWAERGPVVSNFFYFADALPDHWDESVFYPTEADRLPEGTYNMALLETTEGYILFRKHSFSQWKLQNPVMSYWPSYCEVIATGYTADGTPLWQVTSPIFVN